MKIGKPKYTGKHVSPKTETAASKRDSAKPAAEKPAKVQPVKASAPKAERAPLPKGVKIAGIVLAVLILVAGSGALFVNSKLNRLNRSVDASVAKPADGVNVVSDDFAANVDGLEVRSGGGELPDEDDESALVSEEPALESSLLILGFDEVPEFDADEAFVLFPFPELPFPYHGFLSIPFFSTKLSKVSPS